MKNLNIFSTTQADLENLIRLWNDGRVMKWVDYPDGLGYEYEKVQKWFEDYEKNPNSHHFVIDDEDHKFCGELFYRIYTAHNIASLDIKLVPEAQGKGIATQALNALIETVFEEEPDIEEVFTEPSDSNKKAQQLYTRCGLSPRPRPDFLHSADSYWSLERKDWETNTKEKDGQPTS